jgi:hypothetical protein
MAGLYSHTTRVSGTTLTAAIYNADHQNHIDNHVPLMVDDYSTDDTQMQIQTDPYPSSATSRPTTIAGELARIRYQIQQIIGGNTTYWYEDVTVSLNDQARGWNFYL